MSELKSEVDVAVIGAGAAGLSAGRTLQQRGADFLVLEASHRTGGRGYTEEILPGQPFDLGCHWMHSASLNPFVAIADAHGIGYSKDGFYRAFFEDGRWLTDEETAAWPEFYQRQEDAMEAALAAGADLSVWEATAREDRFTPYYDYIQSLLNSADSDQTSVADLMAYNDTGEDWAVREGYGTLIARYGAGLPVTLNAPVTEIDWSGKRLRLTGPKGTVSARAAILTVSTGILAAGDIRFTPDLPDRKAEAIAGLPLGNHNRICLAFDRDVFGPEARRYGIVRTGDSEPMAFNIRPFGYNYVVGVTGGRFADWLERAGQAAAIDYATERLRAAFGSDITNHMVKQSVTAWRGDPWVKGAYSSALPGQAHQRARLAEALEGRLHFAGEATSAKFYGTAHGAYLTGIAAAERAVS